MLAILEAIVYITDEPLSRKADRRCRSEAARLRERTCWTSSSTSTTRPHHGLTVKEVAGGYKMTTKPEHHEAVRAFVKNLNPPLKLSLRRAGDSRRYRLQAADHRAGDHGDPRRTRRRRAEDSARPEADHLGRPEERRRQTDLVQDHQRIPGQFGLRDLNELPSSERIRGSAAIRVQRRRRGAEAAEAAAPERTVEDTIGGSQASE